MSNLYTFKEHYLGEAAGITVTINWGRFNPPTIGHEKLLDVSHMKGTGEHRIYATQTTDSNKNPLEWKTKIKYMRKVFPKHARMILMDKKVKTIFDALVIAHDDGFKNLELVAGSDRVKEFEKLVNKYNGKKGPHGFYDFAEITVISVSFTQGLPKKYKDAEGLMNAVRSGMGLSEEKSFRQDVKLKRASLLREKYVAGNLFNVDDAVTTLDGVEGTISKLSSNHVEVKLKESQRFKTYWLSDVCLNN